MKSDVLSFSLEILVEYLRVSSPKSEIEKSSPGILARLSLFSSLQPNGALVQAAASQKLKSALLHLSPSAEAAAEHWLGGIRARRDRTSSSRLSSSSPCTCLYGLRRLDPLPLQLPPSSPVLEERFTKSERKGPWGIRVFENKVANPRHFLAPPKSLCCECWEEEEEEGDVCGGGVTELDETPLSLSPAILKQEAKKERRKRRREHLPFHLHLLQATLLLFRLALNVTASHAHIFFF